ncbi:MAG: uroporphyrinogen-III C-methyltransferase [Vicinamibacterales bacterium]
MSEGRSDLHRPMVSLVGAGPGDPGLITVRGLECLRTADVVVHDHLIPRRLLAHAREGAELIDVGYASPQAPSAQIAQEAISYLVADKAREGKYVVRLMWGDPFVFDRGGEEALFLHEQHVPYEVVPGIPAGIAIPAFAGVPVTYPGGGDTITLVRGHEDDSRSLPALDWASLARLEGTLVCYAGSQQLPRILQALVSHGWPEDGQALIVYDGTLPSQECVSGSVRELLDGLLEPPVHAARHTALHPASEPTRRPAILVAGRVVGLREHLRWFDVRPLFGRRVLVTRPRDQAADLVDRLAALGADAVEAPMIRIVPPEDPEPLLRAAAEPDAFDWIVFSSANGVDAFMAALVHGDRDIRALKGPRLCTVGTGTAERLARYGIKVDLVPEEFRAEAVVAALATQGLLAAARVLLPRADIGRDVIADELRGRGAIVTEVIAYRTVPDEARRDEDPDVYGMLLERTIDVVTFTSASAVRNFAAIYGADQASDLLKNTAVATIGPVTAEAVTELGIQVTIQPGVYTIPALVDAIAAHFAGVKGTRTA